MTVKANLFPPLSYNIFLTYDLIVNKKSQTTSSVPLSFSFEIGNLRYLRNFRYPGDS